MTLWLSLLVAYVGFSVNINGQIPVDPSSCPGDRHQAWLDTSVKDSQNSLYCGEGSPPGALNSVTDPRDPYVSLTTLAAPKDARKAYERAKKEMGKKTPTSQRPPANSSGPSVCIRRTPPRGTCSESRGWSWVRLLEPRRPSSAPSRRMRTTTDPICHSPTWNSRSLASPRQRR